MKPCKGKRKSLWRYMPPLLIAAAFGFVASEVTATHTVTETEDIRNTKHYMVGNPDVRATGTTEVCVFCHTPHGANPATTGLAPLWNRNIPLSSSYTPYGSPNFDASGIDPGKPKGVSLACLSCHDGTIAVDALINAPGSGGFEVLNRTAAGGGVSIGAISFTSGGIIDPDSTFAGTDTTFRNSTDQNTIGLNPCPGNPCNAASPYAGGIHDTVTGGLGLESATPFPNLDINLSDDHPIGMQVPATGFDAEGGPSQDPQFKLIGDNSTMDGHADDGKNVKYITKNPANTVATDKRDRLRAYPSTGVAGAFYIECASCHNPHTPRVSFLRLPSSLKQSDGSYINILTPLDAIPATWSDVDGAGGANLLWAQKPNSGSAICLSCHQK